MAIPEFETLFPTMVVGSLPRAQWVRDLVEDRTAGKVDEAEADALLDAAVLFAIRMQERAGLDYISDGEFRRENYVRVFADRVEGFRRSSVGGLQATHVVSKIRSDRPIACSDADFLRRNTDRKIIVAIPSPFTVGRHLWHPEHSRKAYPTREEFVEECADIIRKEVIELAKIGVDAIQLDEPWQAWMANPGLYLLNTDEEIQAGVDLSIKMVNRVSQGLDNVFFSVHLCHTHGVEAEIGEKAANRIMDAVNRIHADRVAMEFNSEASGGFEKLQIFPADKLLGLGVIDNTSSEVEDVETVLKRVEKALKYVPKERIVLNPDCGFSTSAASPKNFDTAYQKLRVMCEAAAVMRKSAATD